MSKELEFCQCGTIEIDPPIEMVCFLHLEKSYCDHCTISHCKDHRNDVHTENRCPDCYIELCDACNG